MNVPVDSPLGPPPNATERGREVSSRLAGMYVDACDTRGIPVARLLEGTGLTEAELRDVNRRISWTAFLRLLDNVEPLLGPGALHDTALRFVQSRRATPLRVVSRLLFTPWSVLQWMERPGSGIQLLTSCVDAKVRRLGPERFSVELVLHPGYSASEAWMQMNRGGLGSIPVLFGEDPPEVTAEPLPRGGRFTIQLAPRRSLRNAVRRWAARLLPDREAADQLREALELLHRRHEELERAERERELAQARLLEARNLETVGRLAGGVAHDFNNILTVINAHAERLADPQLDRVELGEATKEIRFAASRAAELTRQLLAFGGRRPMSLRPIRPAEVVLALRGMLERLIGEHIELRVSCPPRSGWVLADHSALEQIVLNLATNARDAMPRGGRLTIEVQDLEETSEHDSGPDAQWVTIEVSDTGCGITDEVKPRIFEPFFTTKELGLGTGLGLATVFGVVKQSGGRIDVFSEAGAGTAFRVLLPRILPEPGAAALGLAAAPEVAAAARPGPLVILFAEDDPHVRAAGVELLTRAGHEVRVARDGDEALRIGRGAIDAIDVLVSDVVMPRLGGPELAAQLRRLRPELPVVLVSGHAPELARSMGGATPHVEKPYDRETLLSAIARAVAAEG